MKIIIDKVSGNCGKGFKTKEICTLLGCSGISKECPNDNCSIIRKVQSSLEKLADQIDLHPDHSDVLTKYFWDLL